MTHKAQMAIDTQQFLNTDEFAETVSYNGDAIAAVVERGKTRESGNTFTSEGEADRAMVWVKATDVASPVIGDVIVIADGTSWEVSRILESDQAMHCLECIANESPW